MSTNYIAPIWRMPRNANKDKLSNYNIDFNGSNQFINFGSSDVFNYGDSVNDFPFSFSVWIYRSTTGGFRILDKGSEWQITINGSNILSFTLFDTNGRYRGRSCSFTETGWNHIVCTYDGRGGVNANDGIKIYANNVQVDDTTVSNGGTYTAMHNLGNDANLARLANGTGYTNGNFSECAVFNYALTDGTGGTTNQINYLYNLNNPMAITGGEPIAYWPLGDNSNPNAPGSFPNISVGADSVFDFNGSTDFVEAPNSSSLQITDNLTLSCWINVNNVTVNNNILDKYYDGTADGRSYLLRVQSSRIYLYLGNASGTIGVSYISNSTLQNNTWYHIATTFSSTEEANKQVKIYINGSLDAEHGKTDLIASNDEEFRIGSSYNTSNRFAGKISNAQVWDTALELSDVEDLYNNGQPLMTGTQPQEANLQAWYKLNQSANYDQGVGPFKIEKVGSPDYSVSGNGCFTTGGVLRWQDTNNQVLSDGDYFTYYSPLILCNSSDVDLITTGGSYQTGPSSGLEYSLEYSVDGGSWVVWKAQTVGTNQSLQNWTVSNVNNLNCNQSIQVRLRAVGGLFGTEQFNFNDVRINVSGVQAYFETFATAGLGWDNNSYTAPTDNYVDPSWQIPDNRSAYPQSFDFNGSDSYINGSSYTFDSDFSISVWGKAYDPLASIYGMICAIGGSYLCFERGTKGFLWDDPTTGVYRSSTNAWEYDKWIHLILVKSGTTLQYYINGQADALTGTSTVTSSGTLTLGRWLGSSSLRLRGGLSNFQLWDTALNATQAETLYNNGVPLTTAIATDNLKGWWKLDNSSTWNGSNWVIDNGLANYETALDFVQSETDYIELDNIVNLGTTWTISFWINTTQGLNSNGTILAAGSGNGFTMLLLRNNRLMLYRGAGTDYNYLLTSTQFNDGKWHNITLVRNGTSEVIVYLDGDIGPYFTSGSGNLDTKFKFIGDDGGTWGTATAFDGALSNIAFFDTALDASAVETIYNNGTPEINISNSPISLWKLDNTSTGIQDSIGSNDGTNNGASEIDTYVSTQSGTSSGMTERNLVNDNVSVLNGESEGMNSTNLVTSNISRTQPYSNYSFNFDSANSDNIDLGNDVFFDTNNFFTFSAWVNLDAYNTNYPYIVNLKTNVTDGFAIFLSNTGAYTGINIGSTDTNITKGKTTGDISSTFLTSWNHIAVIYNGSGANTLSNYSIYVNGSPVTLTTTGAFSTITNVNNLGRLGSGSFYFDGKISNVSIFDEALVQDDVLNLYNNGVPQDLNNFRITPVAWWPMDQRSSYYDGTDWVVRDLINGNDGTGANTGNVDDLVGNAPGSEANGIGTNLAIADLKGDMKDSDKNAYSINMADYADGVTNPANSGRSTDTP